MNMHHSKDYNGIDCHEGDGDESLVMVTDQPIAEYEQTTAKKPKATYQFFKESIYVVVDQNNIRKG